MRMSVVSSRYSASESPRKAYRDRNRPSFRVQESLNSSFCRSFQELTLTSFINLQSEAADEESSLRVSDELRSTSFWEEEVKESVENLMTFIRQLKSSNHPPVDPDWVYMEDAIEEAVEKVVFKDDRSSVFDYLFI